MVRGTKKENVAYLYLQVVDQSTSQYDLRILIHLNGFVVTGNPVVTSPTEVNVTLQESVGNQNIVVYTVPITNSNTANILDVNLKNEADSILSTSKIGYVDADQPIGVSSTETAIPFLYLEKVTTTVLGITRDYILPYVTVQLNGYKYIGEAMSFGRFSSALGDLMVATVKEPGHQGFIHESLKAHSHNYERISSGSNGYCAVAVVEYDSMTNAESDFPTFYNLDGGTRPPRKKRKAKIKNIYA